MAPKMAPKKLMNYIFIAAAALLLVGAFESQQAEARNFAGVNPFCRTTSHRIKCTEMVKGATNHHDAIANAIKSTMVLAKKLRGLVPTIEPAIANLSPVARDSTRKACVDRYDGVIELLNISLEALEAGDIQSVKSNLNNVDSDYCEEAMEEDNVGLDLPIHQYSKELAREAWNAFDVVTQTNKLAAVQNHTFE